MTERLPKHLPVLLKEAVTALAIKPDGVYVDGTFGRGGHSRAILQQLNDDGRLLGLDRDPQAIIAGQALAAEDSRFNIEHCAFSQLSDVIHQRLWQQRIDGILLDIGVSSPQLDEAARGFSFMQDGPLDMRMDTSSGISAAQWLAQAEEVEIATVIKTLGEERTVNVLLVPLLNSASKTR